MKLNTITRTVAGRHSTKERYARSAIGTAPRYTDKRIVASPVKRVSSRPRRPIRTPSEWVRQHQSQLKKYNGQWVAVGSFGVVGHSQNFSAVFAQARKHGVLVFKVGLPHERKIASSKR